MAGGTHTPYDADSNQVVQTLSRQPCHVGVQNVMSIVDAREDAPEPVYLRVVPIDLRDQEENRRYEECESESSYEGIGPQVDILQFSGIIVRLKELLGEIV